MKAFMLFTGSGPLVILTSHGSATEPAPLEKFSAKGIDKFVILLGLALAALITPWSAILSALVGAGLVLAGVTGHCGMADVLSRLLYNRRAARGASGATP